MAKKNARSGSRNALLGSRSTQGTKASRGSTGVSETPLSIRAQGKAIPPVLTAAMPEKLGAHLGPFAHHIDSVYVRFEDINGPRGGVDTECRIQVVLPSRPDIVVSHRAVNARIAFDGASHRIGRAVKRDLARAGFARGSRKSPAVPSARVASDAQNPPPKDGSLIGRRVGTSAANLARAAARPEKLRRDAWVDTAQPGVSASNRRAGAGSTASRNTKLRTPRATAALEDSAQPRPSRKSTRKSANHAQGAQKLAQRARSAASSPQTRAAAAAARGRR